jgi:hypothetical protein
MINSQFSTSDIYLPFYKSFILWVAYTGVQGAPGESYTAGGVGGGGVGCPRDAV